MIVAGERSATSTAGRLGAGSPGAVAGRGVFRADGTPRPGQVKAVIQVDLARPRSMALLGEPRFGQLAQQIRTLLRPPEQAAA